MTEQPAADSVVILIHPSLHSRSSDLLRSGDVFVCHISLPAVLTVQRRHRPTAVCRTESINNCWSPPRFPSPAAAAAAASNTHPPSCSRSQRSSFTSFTQEICKDYLNAGRPCKHGTSTMELSPSPVPAEQCRALTEVATCSLSL